MTNIEYLMANYARLMDSMTDIMLREACHNAIIKKVELEYVSIADKEKIDG